MKHLRPIVSLLVLMMALQAEGWARESVGVQRRVASGYRVASDCLPPSASSQLDINNVRALLHNGGDMWWDLVGDPRYEIPKGGGVHSLFAGSLWIGGLDGSSQLRVAAQTYRQSGLDFWPGPITGGVTGGEASTEEAICDRYNRMFKISKAEIDAFQADYGDNNVIDNPENYPNVFNWPAINNPNIDAGLYQDADGLSLQAFRPDGSFLYAAPFVDVDGDLIYNPDAGDYPDIQGDQAIWWIINDRGNVHTETGGQPIGVEIHMLAFAFTTSNAVNDMTFYRQTVINRSSQLLNETYMGQWVDADLGRFNDDYVGCDTLRGLGFCYNGDANDDGPAGYGLDPPAIGVDFFQGPLADALDGVDNDKDGIVDEDGETIIMSKFVYYNNDFTLIGNPEVAQHYYGYLIGQWKDGSSIVDNFSNGGDGTGYGGSSPGPSTNYMFPGDPCGGSGWTETNADNPPADRRFLQSAGPFTLQPGAVNEIVTGVVWARQGGQDNLGSVCALYSADEVAQALFDNDFVLLDGPDAPELTVEEFDGALVLNWDYPEELADVRNNYNESYQQADPVLKAQGEPDSVYEFQGYIVYQLIDGTVGPNELQDTERARPVAQCDIVDGVATIVNRTVQALGGSTDEVIVDQVMVEGSNEGIFHSVQVNRDLFATDGDSRLKNYTTYHYAVIAYAYNSVSSDGRQFVPGNRFYRVISAEPHPVGFENGGTLINAQYGDELPITQISGVGNGGNFVRLTPETEAEILANGATTAITYQEGAAPIRVRVTNPKAVTDNYFRLRVVSDSLVELDTVAPGANPIIDSVLVEWVLYESNSPNVPLTNPVFVSTYLKRNDGSSPRPEPLVNNEVLIPNRGISVLVRNVSPAGDTLDVDGEMGIIGGELSFDDPSSAWLDGLEDLNEGLGGIWNWIVGVGEDGAPDRTYKQFGLHDKYGYYQNILNGRVGPFTMARGFDNSLNNIAPGLAAGPTSTNRVASPDTLVGFEDLPDVDLVLTSDRSKWSRCVVVETSPNQGLGSGAWPLSAKWRDNVDQNGASELDKEANSGTADPEHGMGWFPGYAINVNTGQRLNVFFGESEWDADNDGDDMLWNPTANFGSNLDKVGGRHYIYVTRLPYDECESIKDVLQNENYAGINGFPTALRILGRTDGGDTLFNHYMVDAYRHVAWTAVPLRSFGYDSIDLPNEIPTDARISLRMRQPFRSRDAAVGDVPEFTFNTEGRAIMTRVTDTARAALDDILVVPNPYYAYSAYENGQLDNRVRITNLPQLCRINIFTLNGNLVRQYFKDSPNTFQDWDIKNEAGVLVGSGVYIIHINADIGDQNLGEKVVKLFVVQRALDLDNF